MWVNEDVRRVYDMFTVEFSLLAFVVNVISQKE